VNDLKPLIKSASTRAAELRHAIHRRPELGYEERETSALVQQELTDLGISFEAGLAGGTGVLAHLPGADSAPSVALRADMDALPITERTGKPYASETTGVMHACGHDGHTAMLLGAARVLKELDLPRPVTLLFQPAEEGGGGGKRMVDEGALAGLVIGPKIEEIFGLHGWPDAPLGAVGTIPGPMLASTDQFVIRVIGRQAHGAMPHQGRDPILAASHIVTALQAISARNVDPLDACVVTVGAIHGGSAPNVIPEAVELVGTIRALTDDTRQMARQRVKETAERVALALDCGADVDLIEGYPVTVNDADLVNRVHSIAARAMGDDNVVPMQRPVMGAEDFSFYGAEARACFFTLGLCPEGETYPLLHTPEFDFNDDAIPAGVEMLVRCAIER
jgi:amidohydrolase